MTADTVSGARGQAGRHANPVHLIVTPINVRLIVKYQKVKTSRVADQLQFNKQEMEWRALALQVKQSRAETA